MAIRFPFPMVSEYSSRSIVFWEASDNTSIVHKKTLVNVYRRRQIKNNIRNYFSFTFGRYLPVFIVSVRVKDLNLDGALRINCFLKITLTCI